MSSADFLKNPKRALGIVSNGTQVCVESNEVQIILGFEHAGRKAVTKKALYRRTKRNRTFTSPTAGKPADISWLE